MSRKEQILKAIETVCCVLSLVEYMTKNSFPFLLSLLLSLQLLSLIDSCVIVATMAIVSGPHPLRATMTSRPSANGYITLSATFLHSLTCRRSEVSRKFERTSTQELLFSSSIKINSNDLAVQNMSHVYMGHI